MSRFNRWKSGTAALMALTITAGAAAPFVTSAPAAAQYYEFPPPPVSQVSIPSGTTLPLRYNKANKIVVSPKETMPLMLTVATNVRNTRGTILIPAGTQVVGQLQPATRGGSQFVARELVFNNGKRQYINASSRVITRTEQVSRGTNTNSILKGAAVGGAAAAAIGALVGDRAIATEEILGGAGLGALGGLLLGKRKVDVVVVNPNTDLNVTLRSALALR
ncbi:hypothetical protein [Coleofasciculus sp. FACHB-1120]|uniref:hypothetical protein n=1 Tax=Coleofasciculus sp. FACHB-1120 TaxID=2692783 RepID=UPI00168468F9|nr:hypothetical protein [Coleofasciculus sp. FACHB-1120]MBD2743944.1 hypothetical protein [Coleofasciculus sp. FACHB-1120]